MLVGEVFARMGLDSKQLGTTTKERDVYKRQQLKGAGEKNFDANEAKRKDPREIELVILKNRNGRTGRCV